MKKEKTMAAVTILLAAAILGGGLLLAHPAVRRTDEGMYAPFTMADRYVRVLTHPAFQTENGEKAGRFLIPFNTDLGKAAGALTRIEASPFPDRESLLDALNALLAQQNAGEPVFYELYSESEKAEDLTKKDTGLFYLKGKPGMPFILLNGGGGYVDVAVLGEALAAGLDFQAKGYHVFAHKYRAETNLAQRLGRSSYEIAADDVACALRLILDHAEQFGLDPDSYAVCGFSAGAALTEGWGSSQVGYGKYGLPKPDCVMLIYGAGLTLGREDTAELTADYPPSFVIGGEQDAIVNASLPVFKEAAESLGIPLYYQIYPNAGHGFGHGGGTGAEG